MSYNFYQMDGSVILTCSFLGLSINKIYVKFLDILANPRMGTSRHHCGFRDSLYGLENRVKRGKRSNTPNFCITEIGMAPRNQKSAPDAILKLDADCDFRVLKNRAIEHKTPTISFFADFV